MCQCELWSKYCMCIISCGVVQQKLKPLEHLEQFTFGVADFNSKKYVSKDFKN